MTKNKNMPDSYTMYFLWFQLKLLTSWHIIWLEYDFFVTICQMGWTGVFIRK